MQAGRNDNGTDPFPPSRMEMMIGPKPREQWKQFQTKHELVAALGERLRERIPHHALQLHPADHRQRHRGHQRHFGEPGRRILAAPTPTCCLNLARQTVELLRTVPGALDVSIEQEGPQPQLVIQPDRALCARYNVRIEDVKRLINMALGGEPVGTLYEGDRRFDIVAKLDRSVVTSPQAIGRLPVHTADGIARAAGAGGQDRSGRRPDARRPRKRPSAA